MSNILLASGKKIVNWEEKLLNNIGEMTNYTEKSSGLLLYLNFILPYCE